MNKKGSHWTSVWAKWLKAMSEELSGKSFWCQLGTFWKIVSRRIRRKLNITSHRSSGSDDRETLVHDRWQFHLTAVLSATLELKISCSHWPHSGLDICRKYRTAGWIAFRTWPTSILGANKMTYLHTNTQAIQLKAIFSATASSTKSNVTLLLTLTTSQLTKPISVQPVSVVLYFE